MNRRSLVSLLALLLLLVSAIGALAASKRTYTYTGKTSAGEPVKLSIGFTTYNNSTWVMYQEYGYNTCANGSAWAVNGGVHVQKDGSFGDRDVTKYKGGWVRMMIVHGKVSGWDAKRKAWKKATGTFRVFANGPAYEDDNGVSHPAYQCDDTFHWTATRRG
ncbi:MAG: hypothetical protein ABSB96_02640 [Gaiellaceae bacterium]